LPATLGHYTACASGPQQDAEASPANDLDTKSRRNATSRTPSPELAFGFDYLGEP